MLRLKKSLYSITLGLVACSVFGSGTAVRAQSTPGIDRPVAEVLQSLGALLHCHFASADMETLYGCGDRLAGVSTELWRSAGKQSFNTVTMDVFLARDRGRPTNEEIENAETAIDTILYLAPDWPDARNWLTSAVTAADTDQACSYVKINGMVISIRPYHYVDHEGSYAGIAVTRNFDIYSLCDY